MALDPSSVAEPLVHNVEHVHLDFVVDIFSRCIYAVASMTVHVHGAGHTLNLDVRDLDVEKAWLRSVDGATHPLDFAVTAFAAFGDRLSVTLPANIVGKQTICVAYTAGKGPATAWLAPEQTADGKLPFLFTQGQASLNRSLFPCQDSPSTRMSYSATVVVPRPFTALMSARMTGRCVAYPDQADDKQPQGLAGAVQGDACFHSNPYCAPATGGRTGQALGQAVTAEMLASLVCPGAKPQDVLPARLTSDLAAWHAFSFSQPLAIPSYLVALVVGDLRCAEIGPRSRVWAEPSVVQAAAHEYGHGGITETYVATAERLFGPYRWGRYDVCVLPPAFPYGGMENPNLTTLNPKTIAGDQSLSDVLCHEILHSWFGNSVTNNTWSSFFLNEGFTMYGQRRVTQEVHGRPFTALETTTGRELLRGLMRDIGHTDALTRLVVPLAEGVDPDDTYTEAPYEKGFAFVSYLKELSHAVTCASAAEGKACPPGCGDLAFDGWLTTYVTAHAFKCVGPADMLRHYCREFPGVLGLPTGADEVAVTAALDSFVTDAGLAAAGRGYWGSDSAVPPAAGDAQAVGANIKPPSAAAVKAAPSSTGGGVNLPGYELSRWLHQPGWPPYYPDLSEASQLTGPAEELARAWWEAGEAAAATKTATASAPPSVPSYSTWPTYQRLHFLDTLQARLEASQAAAAAQGQYGWLPAVHSMLAGMEKAYCIGTSGNAELRLRWATLVARAQWAAGYPSLTDFSRGTGKQKYTMPVYRALLAAPAVPSNLVGGIGSELVHPGRDLALALFGQTRAALHTEPI